MIFLIRFCVLASVAVLVIEAARALDTGVDVWTFVGTGLALTSIASGLFSLRRRGVRLHG